LGENGVPNLSRWGHQLASGPTTRLAGAPPGIRTLRPLAFPSVFESRSGTDPVWVNPVAGLVPKG